MFLSETILNGVKYVVLHFVCGTNDKNKASFLHQSSGRLSEGNHVTLRGLRVLISKLKRECLIHSVKTIQVRGEQFSVWSCKFQYFFLDIIDLYKYIFVIFMSYLLINLYF